MIEKFRIKFSKEGIVRFISHLEMVTFLRRAVRRAKLPVIYSQGFNPQIRLALGPALPLGYESQTEYFDLELARRQNPEEIRKQLNLQMPEGFSIIEVRPVPILSPSLEEKINLAEYEIFANIEEERIKAFFKQDKFIISKIKKGKEEKIDIRRLVLKMTKDGQSLKLLLLFGPKQNVRPELILQKIFNFSEALSKQTLIRRINLYNRKENLEIVEP